MAADDVWDDVRDEIDRALPHTMGCAAHRGGLSGGCICFNDKAMERLLPAVERLMRKAAAEALRDAADWLWDDNGPGALAYHELIARAEAAEVSRG